MERAERIDDAVLRCVRIIGGCPGIPRSALTLKMNKKVQGEDLQEMYRLLEVEPSVAVRKVGRTTRYWLVGTGRRPDHPLRQDRQGPSRQRKMLP